MNEQGPIKKEWKEVKEEVIILIHNTEINLAMLKAQLEEAEKHSK